MEQYQSAALSETTPVAKRATQDTQAPATHCYAADTQNRHFDSFGWANVGEAGATKNLPKM
jgi:hypothetical protein